MKRLRTCQIHPGEREPCAICRAVQDEGEARIWEMVANAYSRSSSARRLLARNAQQAYADGRTQPQQFHRHPPSVEPMRARRRG